MSRLSRLAGITAVAAGSLLAAQGTARADVINVVGSTTGCFNCTPADVATSPTTLAGLTFTGTSFDVWTNAAGSATISDLGSFSLNRSVPYNYAGDDFLLRVLFSVPTGVGGGGTGNYAAFLTGNITQNNNGGTIDVHFDNTFQTFPYSNGSGSGSFDFAVTNDISLKTTGPSTTTVTGAVQNAEFTPVAVPEPATLLLFGAGLASLRLRRRTSR